MKPEHHLSRHLVHILGEADFVRLCEEFGGTRLYVPFKGSSSDVAEAIGTEAAEKLSRAMAPATIRVPLARRERALFYRRKDMSNARIARKLGMTETGVNKLFAAESDLSDRPGLARATPQFELF